MRGLILFLAVFLVGVAVGLLIDRDNNGGGYRYDDLPAVWSGVVEVGGDPVEAELLPEGDGYKLCVTPPGAERDTCVTVTDSNGVDARLEPTPTGDLFIILAGSDRPFDLPNAEEVPLETHRVQGALLAVDVTGDCVSFFVPDPPAGGSERWNLQRTIYGGELAGDGDGSGAAAAEASQENSPTCHRLN